MTKEGGGKIEGNLGENGLLTRFILNCKLVD
jgi:hypothetical protein